MTDSYPIPDFLRTPKPFVRVPIERPILFSAPMVRALLAGTKTQTRRVVKLSEEWHPDTRTAKVIGIGDDGVAPMPFDEFGRMLGQAIRCPYGQPGDRLWVREAWSQPTTLDPGPTFYRADYPACVPPHFENVPPADKVKWKPSIHMRRADSRITLEVVAIRVDRLQDISERDAEAEGCLPMFPDDVSGASYVYAYSRLWESINGPGSWAENPWVWCVEFRRI